MEALFFILITIAFSLAIDKKNSEGLFRKDRKRFYSKLYTRP